MIVQKERGEEFAYQLTHADNTFYGKPGNYEL